MRDPASRVYWTVIKAAGGIVSEQRFSGSNITPCKEQILWSYYNVLLDQGINIDAEDINEYSDHMLYELSKHMDVKDIARKFYNTTLEEIQNRIWKYTEQLAAYKAMRGIKDG